MTFVNLSTTRHPSGCPSICQNVYFNSHWNNTKKWENINSNNILHRLHWKFILWDSESIIDTNPCACKLVTRAPPCRAIEKYVFMCGFVLQNSDSMWAETISFLLTMIFHSVCNIAYNLKDRTFKKKSEQNNTAGLVFLHPSLRPTGRSFNDTFEKRGRSVAI